MTTPHNHPNSRFVWVKSIGMLIVMVMVFLTGCTSPPAHHGPNEARRVSLLTALADHQLWQEVIDQFHHSPEGRDIPVELFDIHAVSLTQIDQHIDLVNPASKNALRPLIDQGIIDPAWDQDATSGVPVTSLVSFVVRPGNPHHIHDWADLLAPGVTVISSDPTASGWAQWPLVAAWGATSQAGTHRQDGLAYLYQLITTHMSIVGQSQDQAQELFVAGHADVLLGCEYTNLALVHSHPQLVHLLPRTTLKVEIPLAITTTSNPINPTVQLRNFQYSPTAQRIWASAGLRPVDPLVAEEFSEVFPSPDHVMTISQLGGWDMLDTQLFEHNSGIITRLYRQHFPQITPKS